MIPGVHTCFDAICVKFLTSRFSAGSPCFVFGMDGADQGQHFAVGQPLAIPCTAIQTYFTEHPSQSTLSFFRISFSLVSWRFSVHSLEPRGAPLS